MDPGAVGGIVGSVGGVMGGALGAYFSLKNATRPREHALIMRLGCLMSLWIAGMLTVQFLLPRPWNQAAIFMILPLLLSIPRMNRWSAEARILDEADRVAAGKTSRS